VATWAGVTRSNEPCEGDPARHRGTVLRFLARDTEVAARLAEDVRAAEQQAFVMAGEHEYGVQLDGQLDFVGLPRAAAAEDADPGRALRAGGAPGGGARRRARAAGGRLRRRAGRRAVPDCSLMLPFTPDDDMGGTTAAARAATLISEAAAGGARDRTALLSRAPDRGPVR
jgi:hypothetical protein